MNTLYESLWKILIDEINQYNIGDIVELNHFEKYIIEMTAKNYYHARLLTDMVVIHIQIILT